MEIEFYIENSKPCRESRNMAILDERAGSRLGISIAISEYFLL
jgi:hypothetical protein